MSYTRVFMLTDAPPGLAATGMRCQLYDLDGSTNGAALSNGFAEVPANSGCYLRQVTLPDNFVGAVRLYVATNLLDGQSWAVDPQDGEYLDAKITTRATPADLLAVAGAIGAKIHVTSPLLVDASLVLVAGDDYNNADGRHIDVHGLSPYLNTATSVTVTARSVNGQIKQTLTASILDLDTVRLQPTATETGGLDPRISEWEWEIRANYPSSRTSALLMTRRLFVEENLASWSPTR